MSTRPLLNNIQKIDGFFLMSSLSELLNEWRRYLLNIPGYTRSINYIPVNVSIFQCIPVYPRLYQNTPRNLSQYIELVRKFEGGHQGGVNTSSCTTINVNIDRSGKVKIDRQVKVIIDISVKVSVARWVKVNIDRSVQVKIDRWIKVLTLKISQGENLRVSQG